MNTLSRLDLNLVRLFVAVYETQSTTLAAARLFITQPSVSYGLARLREQLGDPLFVRSPAGMVPTLLAEEAYLSFSQGLARIHDGLESVRAFDAATSERRFRIGMSDLGAFAFLPGVLARLYKSAPHLEIEIDEPPVDKVPSLLGSGRLDAAIGNLASINTYTENSVIFREYYACLVCADHRLAHGKMRLEDYANARHIYVSSPLTWHQAIEKALRDAGIQRKVALQLRHFSAITAVLPGTDLVATLPMRAARILSSLGPLKCVSLPLEVAEMECRLHWDARRATHAPVKWFLDSLTVELDAFARKHEIDPAFPFQA